MNYILINFNSYFNLNNLFLFDKLSQLILINKLTLDFKKIMGEHGGFGIFLMLNQCDGRVT